MITEERAAAIEAELRSVTDNVGRLMDQVAQKGFVPAFQCGHSGLYFPGNYVKEWGKLYGVGLGMAPVSEVLDSDYDQAPPEITPDIRRIEQIMHPARVSFAQVDFVMVDPRILVEGRKAILELEDKDMEERGGILLEKQMRNPKSRIITMHAKWAELRKEKGVR